MIIIQVKPQVRDFTIQAASVYVILFIELSLPFPTICHTNGYYLIAMICTILLSDFSNS